jgi:hypothetical protein
MFKGDIGMGLITRYQFIWNQAKGRCRQHEPGHSTQSPRGVDQIEHHQDFQADQRESSGMGLGGG